MLGNLAAAADGRELPHASFLPVSAEECDPLHALRGADRAGELVRLGADLAESIDFPCAGQVGLFRHDRYLVGGSTVCMNTIRSTWSASSAPFLKTFPSSVEAPICVSASASTRSRYAAFSVPPPN